MRFLNKEFRIYEGSNPDSYRDRKSEGPKVRIPIAIGTESSKVRNLRLNYKYVFGKLVLNNIDSKFRKFGNS